MDKIIFKHKLINRGDFRIPLTDRSFRFGDGCFETILFHNRKCFYLDAHLERLKKSAQSLSISLKFAKIKTEIRELIAANSIENGILRIIVSRGVSNLGYLPKSNSESYYLIEVTENSFEPPENRLLWLSKWVKPTAEMLPVNFKYNGNVNSVLARIEASENSCFESLQLTNEGYISECSSSNIAWIKNERLFAPDATCDCLNGITLSLLNQISGNAIQFGKFKLTDLLNADEIMVMNTAWGIVSIDSIPQKKKSYSRNKSDIYAQLFNQHILDYCN